MTGQCYRWPISFFNSIVQWMNIEHNWFLLGPFNENIYHNIIINEFVPELEANWLLGRRKEMTEQCTYSHSKRTKSSRKKKKEPKKKNEKIALYASQDDAWKMVLIKWKSRVKQPRAISNWSGPFFFGIK